jgi:hypothetical protein
MNKTTTLLTLAGLLVLGGAHLETRADAERTPLQKLQSIKEQNQKVIDLQAATLLKLDDVTKDAEQLRTFSKRS